MTGILRHFVWLGAVACALSNSVSGQKVPAVGCARCGWRPPATNRTIAVKTVSDLYRAVADARPDTTILLADGEYRLDHMLDLHAPRVVLRGNGAADKVVLRGAGMAEQLVGVALSISAADITIADITIGFVKFHGIQVRGERGASRFMAHNIRIVDTGQQLIKGSADGGSLHADDGVVACSRLEYSDHAPSDYTNAIDVLAGNGWTVRDNTIRRIHGPATQGYAAGPAVLFWANARGTLVERNLIVDSFRGIALGLGRRANAGVARDADPTYDHRDGWVRNNVVVNFNPWADEGIEANQSSGVRIDHNTVLTAGRLPWSISLRFSGTDGYARNNLTTRPIVRRDNGRGILAGNVSGAATSWFVDPPNENFQLARPDVAAVDAGVPIPTLPEDMARRPRISGSAPDAGAFER